MRSAERRSLGRTTLRVSLDQGLVVLTRIRRSARTVGTICGFETTEQRADAPGEWGPGIFLQEGPRQLARPARIAVGHGLHLQDLSLGTEYAVGELSRILVQIAEGALWLSRTQCGPGSIE